jgi:putative ABC transport system permease protein
VLRPGGRWIGVVGAFVAVTVGVALVCLSTQLLAAGRPQVPQRFAAAAVVVASPDVATPADPFPEPRPWSSATATELVERLATIAGVDAATADRTFYAQAVVDGRPDPAVTHGYGWSSSRLGEHGLRAGAPPRRDGEVVLGDALGRPPGARVTLLTATGPATYTVSGVVDGSGIYLSDAAAAALSPGVRAIGLVLRPGADADRVARAARAMVGTDGRVLTGADRSALEQRADARTRWIGMQVLTAVATLAGFVAIFVVAATFALDVHQRRRELGLLRMTGATPGQLRRLLAREALTVAAAATLLGVIIGTALAPTVGDVLVDVGFEPATYRVGLAAWPIGVSLAVGLVVALLGVWAASHRASRVRPLEALREAAVEPRAMSRTRWSAGLLCGAAGLGLAAGTATAGDQQQSGTLALASAMALVVAATVLAPALVPPLAGLLAWPLARGRGATGVLVREGARTAARRTAGAAAPVLLTVAFAVIVSGLVQTSTAAYTARRTNAIAAGSVVAPDGTPGLTDAVVAATPGAALLPTTVYLRGTEPLAALGVDPVTIATANRELTVRSGSLADLAVDNTVVVTETVARRFDWGQGRSLAVTFADGESRQVRTVAVVADSSIPAGLLLSAAVVRAHDPSALTSAILATGPVSLPPGAGARLIDVATYAAEADRAEDRLVWIFTLLLIGVSAGYGAIAVANTLLMSAASRRHDYRVLRLSGATARQLAWIAAAEAVFVVALGSLLGGTVAVVALLSIRDGLAAQVGVPVDVVVPWPTIGAVVGVCLVLAVVASVLPTRAVRTSADHRIVA